MVLEKTALVIYTALLLCRGSICSSSGGSLPEALPPTFYNASISEGGCFPSSVLDAARTSHLEAVRQVVRKKVLPILCPDCPPCVCGGQGEWLSVATLNFTDPTVDCPANWNLVTSPVRGCVRSTSAGPSCDSAFFSTGTQSYSRVCGSVVGVQGGGPDAFAPGIHSNPGVDGVYIDGVSITHGQGPRQHIWSFAVALYEDSADETYLPSAVCPCTNSRDWPFQVPEFVGSNYFCATGTPGPSYNLTAVYSDNPLWDGEGCGFENTCCQFNNPPYFCTRLPEPTTDDLELRICHDQNIDDESTVVTSVNLFIM